MTEAHKCMLYGSQVLFAATPLVADVIPWSCSDMFPSYQQYIISTLRPLFQDIRYDSILTKEIHSPRGRSYEVAMRNSFKYEKNRVIAVEFPCFDVAAWFRIWHLYQMFKYDSLPISVLCVFDNDTQARSFCDMLGCKIAHINPSMQKEGLYMTFRYLLGQPKKIVSLVPGEDITL